MSLQSIIGDISLPILSGFAPGAIQVPKANLGPLPSSSSGTVAPAPVTISPSGVASVPAGASSLVSAPNPSNALTTALDSFESALTAGATSAAIWVFLAVLAIVLLVITLAPVGGAISNAGDAIDDTHDRVSNARDNAIDFGNPFISEKGRKRRIATAQAHIDRSKLVSATVGPGTKIAETAAETAV